MTEIIAAVILNIIYKLNRNNSYIEVIEWLKDNGCTVCRNGYGEHRVIEGGK